MRRILLRLGVLFAAAVVSVSLVACSSDDEGLLPGDDAQQILTNLERVEELAGDGECDAAIESIETISRQVENLPASVSGRLRQNLRRGVSRLSTVTTESCGTGDSDTDEETVTVPETTETEIETTPEETTEERDRGTTTPERGGRGQDNRGGGGNGAGGDRGASGQGPGGRDRSDQGGQGRSTPPPAGEQQQPPSDPGADSGGISPAEPVEPSGEEQP